MSANCRAILPFMRGKEYFLKELTTKVSLKRKNGTGKRCGGKKRKAEKKAFQKT